MERGKGDNMRFVNQWHIYEYLKNNAETVLLKDLMTTFKDTPIETLVEGMKEWLITPKHQ
jgi:hypothetical protein